MGLQHIPRREKGEAQMNILNQIIAEILESLLNSKGPGKMYRLFALGLILGHALGTVNTVVIITAITK